MPHWIFKAVAHRIISFLPRSHFWNYLGQRYVTKSLELNTGRYSFEQKLIQCRKHLDNYFAIVPPGRRNSFSVVELGTGWHPIIPVGLYLCGALKIWTIDKRPLLSSARVRKVLGLFIDYDKKGGLVKRLPMLHKNRIYVLRSILNDKDDKTRVSAAEILKKLNIYAIQDNAEKTKLETSPIDLFVSNNTLEHIREDALYDIFTEFRRIASPQAVMSHFIDMADHYANFDHSITPYNFLKYPAILWMLFNNSWQYQNRLRLFDYRKIHQATDWRIQYEQNIRGSLKDFQNIKIAKKFQHYSQKELLVISSWIISRCN